ncbi:MAG: D-alanyl-D-alanine carboxypeptidase [Endozoicomonadaceae bacterium]|nr:D-alanyl-D-alanine carboxypeptidase [Endozoicomonadaceae bacterium]
MLFSYKKIFWISVTLLIISSKDILGVAAVSNINADKSTTLTDSGILTPIVPPPKLNAEAYVLMDYESGEVITGHNIHEHRPPASLTKMMTAYVVYSMLSTGQFTKNDKVLISKNAWKTRGSTMFLEAGEKVSVLNLLKGLIVVSGNDAAVALAEYVAGSEEGFVQLMNTTAQQMGLKDTNFEDANGLPDKDHYSSAYDQAKIAWHTIHDYPEYYPLYSIKEFQHGTDKKTGEPLAPQTNRITLLWSDKYVDGLKTGHTESAGYCLAISSKRDNRRLIAVILNAPNSRSRDIEAQKLLAYGYRFFSTVKPVTANKTLKTVQVWKGDSAELSVSSAADVWVTVPRSEESKVTASVVLDEDKIIAPVNKGQKVGNINILLNGKVLKTAPAIAEKAINKGGFFRRFWDSIRLFFSNLF